MSNRRKQLLEIHPDQLEGLSPKFGDALNDRLKRIEEQLEAAAGKRGIVKIGPKKEKRKKGQTVGRTTIEEPAMHLEDNRIAMVADPHDDQDVVNLRTLKRMLQENDPDVEDEVTDLIDDEDPAEGISGSGIITAGLGVPVTAGATTVNFPANTTTLIGFMSYGSFTFDRLYCERGSAAGGVYSITLGVYNSDRDLVVQGEAVDVSGAVQLVTVTVTPTTLAPGFYWFAVTSENIINLRAATIAAVLLAAVNDSLDPNFFFGTDAAATTNGFLNPSIATITEGTGSHPSIWAASA
jgi:hypothetical protein